jgi:hypothetical protein
MVVAKARYMSQSQAVVKMAAKVPIGTHFSISLCTNRFSIGAVETYYQIFWTPTKDGESILITSNHSFDDAFEKLDDKISEMGL